MTFCTDNVALHKSTSQSGAYVDQYGTYDPSRAVDGDIYNCAEPLAATRNDYAWWKVDLGDFYKITSVTIFNVNANNRKL